MVLATSLNAIMMIAFCITLMFCIGDEEAVANSILPITEVFYSATKSKAAATAMTTMMGFVLMIGNFNILASVARLVWRFASDKGLPFYEHFTYVSIILTESEPPTNKKKSRSIQPSKCLSPPSS
jgi:hypothetical protein